VRERQVIKDLDDRQGGAGAAAAPSFSLNAAFGRAAQWTALQCGRPLTFILAGVVIVVWAVTGPAFHYSDTWQLIINTGTTIITFLMVFLIQNTQNRDMAVLQLKLDELIRVSENARDRLLDLEGLSDDDLVRLKKNFVRLADKSDDAQLHEAVESLSDAEAKIDGARAAIDAVEQKHS
jgi:low affinity Fe/Cu permease